MDIIKKDQGYEEYISLLSQIKSQIKVSQVKATCLLYTSCYKFNRRYFGENQFDRLLIAAVSCAPDFKSRIYNRNYCG